MDSPSASSDAGAAPPRGWFAVREAIEAVRRYAGIAVLVARVVAVHVWENRPSWTMTALTWIGIALFCLYVGVAAILYFAQRSMMYFPETIHTTPAQAGLPEAEEVTLTTADGEKIVAWHVPPRDDKPVILYFHGNGGALRYRVERFRKFVSDGVGLVGVEYRGYAGSSGQPTEAGLIADAEAGYAFAAARYPARQIALWGESLGSGVATALAAEKPVGASDPRSAVHLCRRGRRPTVLVHAGAAVDEGPIPFRRTHRQSHRAGADPARRARPHRAVRDGRADVRTGQIAQGTSCAFSTAITRISTHTARCTRSAASSPAIWTERDRFPHKPDHGREAFRARSAAAGSLRTSDTSARSCRRRGRSRLWPARICR